ncbi:relaxase/mobilization nuclease domain-containing protein [Sphingomonas sp. PL-96]|uniref:TraI/MobA(P) family conjugative relaxase n=1 Tax=Sphingomonas sp. PL-96 TaxID=2887201 RepID=UPI001E2B1988|nr:TraI/MobA(P) family conjugative relaxase [Sphingomonas sp. PL-96]MCC2978172.1 relaxase/mobilization nuclease domain-containing protein [Sphingomonas sp. PL-96]
MIAKHSPMKVTRKSDFAGLVRYITSAQGRDERVGEITITNSTAYAPEGAAYDAMLVQSANHRAAADKTYHLIVSFAPGEHPDPAVVRDIEERLCIGLGFAEHQRISAVHHDTDHTHLHIAINKIHPDRLTIHTPLRDYRTLAELCERLEIEHGLERTNHQSRKRGGETRAADMEQIAGLESMIGWVRRTCGDEIKAADSWQSLHAAMAANGLAMQARGNGLVVVAQNGTVIKASSIARELSRKALEGRLGPFVAADAAQVSTVPVRAYEPRPMPSRVNTAELFARYQDQQNSRRTARSAELAAASAKKAAAIEAVKRAGRLRRGAIKLTGGSGLTRKISYSLASHAAKQALNKIAAAYSRERDRINKRNDRMGWHDWLQVEAKAGNVEALAALRAREGRRHTPANAVQASPTAGHGLSAIERADHITKRGTIIYRTAGAAVRDDGARLHVSRGAEIEGITAALRIARERYGEELSITGSAEFRERVAQAAASASLPIRFNDPELERRRQALAAGPDRQETVDKARRYAGRMPPIARIGRNPPPQAHGRVRHLSELGMVDTAGRPSLLMRNRDAEAPRERLLRWNVPRAGAAPERIDAAGKYIAEREAKRRAGMDVPKHRPFEAGHGPLSYAGTREVEGQKLALLRRGDEIMVLPVDAASAARAARLAVGDRIEIGADGALKGRGRGR